MALECWTTTWKRLKEAGELAKSEPRFTPNSGLNRMICLWMGDMTRLKIDAIVNAANSALAGGGGIDGAIHRAAGKMLMKACRKLGGCKTGDAKITPGFDLPASHVIHTVGPVGKKPELLSSCYWRSLEVAVDNKLRSVCFCCVSTGIYGYPNEAAAHVALQTVRKWLETDENATKLDRVVFCCFMEIDLEIYTGLLQHYFPVSDDEVCDCAGVAAAATGTPDDTPTPELDLRRNLTAVPTATKRERSTEKGDDVDGESDVESASEEVKVCRSSTV